MSNRASKVTFLTSIAVKTSDHDLETQVRGFKVTVLKKFSKPSVCREIGLLCNENECQKFAILQRDRLNRILMAARLAGLFRLHDGWMTRRRLQVTWINSTLAAHWWVHLRDFEEHYNALYFL